MLSDSYRAQGGSLAGLFAKANSEARNYVGLKNRVGFFIKKKDHFVFDIGYYVPLYI